MEEMIIFVIQEGGDRWGLFFWFVSMDLLFLISHGVSQSSPRAKRKKNPNEDVSLHDKKEKTRGSFQTRDRDIRGNPPNIYGVFQNLKTGSI